MGKYSNYRGVTKTHNLWQAQIYEKNHTIYIGCYPTEIEAARAYNKKIMSMYHNRNLTNPLPGDKDYGVRATLSSTRGAKKGCFMDKSNDCNKTSIYKGVYWDRYWGCWKVDIKRYGFRYQALFEEEIEAAINYDIAMIRKYGQNKVKFLNFMYTINDTNGHRKITLAHPKL